ncbi:unnamed protein product [Cyclocybe aegerita]|uniref:Uncharacterized protein n=1 Tax=Cyclocybe aegerita TaxID=1973307 RepID=A0A8S0WAT5_CYCAE|nr:unnamed protein product [Cyclocybe aegerita]
MFVRECTPLPCGPAFALRQSPFDGPATVALATSGFVGGVTLAYFVQAHFNRRLLAAPVNVTYGNLNHTAIVHPICPVGPLSFDSGDVLDKLMCPTPFDHGDPGPMCDPLSRMHALEVDNWFSPACEAGDAPGTDLIVLPSVPSSSPLTTCTDVGRYIPGDMIVYSTGERSISVYYGSTPAIWSVRSKDLFSIHGSQKVSCLAASFLAQHLPLDGLDLKSIIAGLTVISGLHNHRGVPLQTPTVDELVAVKSFTAASVVSSPRNPRLVPTMMEAQLATSALVAVNNPEPSARTLTIARHIRDISNYICVLLVFLLIILCIFKTFIYTEFKVSFYFAKRRIRTLLSPWYVALASVSANEVSEEQDDFFYPTPILVDDTSIEEVQASPVKDHNVPSFVDAQSVAPESEQDAAVEDIKEATLSEEARLNVIEEEVNEETINSSAEIRPIPDEATSSAHSSLLDPEASPFVPGALKLPSASTSTTLETVESPPAPSAIPTHISARPPGRRRRKHHRKNKNKAVEINLLG